jgi:Ca-activated chloride channel homolog
MTTRGTVAAIAATIFLSNLLAGFDPFQSSNTNIEEGNAKLGAGKIKEALEYYDKAAKELPDEPGVQYNRGIALHRLGQFEKARQALLKGTLAADRELKTKSFYNLGNALFDLKRYKEAADAYRRSLQLQPSHRPSKWNLELALRKVREEEKKKKEQEKKDKEKNKNKDKDKKDKDQQGKDQKDQGQKDKDQKEKDRGKPEAKKDQKKDRDRSSKEKEREREKQRQEARREKQNMNDTLDALDRNDKNLQRQRARLLGGDLRKPVKDW